MNRKCAVFLGRQVLPWGSEELSRNISVHCVCSGNFSPSWFPACENCKGPHSVTFWFISDSLAVPKMLKKKKNRQFCIHTPGQRKQRCWLKGKISSSAGCLVQDATAKRTCYKVRPAWSERHRDPMPRVSSFRTVLPLEIRRAHKVSPHSDKRVEFSYWGRELVKIMV